MKHGVTIIPITITVGKKTITKELRIPYIKLSVEEIKKFYGKDTTSFSQRKQHEKTM